MKSLYLLYHELRSAPSDYSYVVQSSAFEQQMDLFSHLAEASPKTVQPKITFDDGHMSNYSVALPILHARDLQAHFFITVGWTGQKPGYMGWPELRALHEAGQTIGAHGWTHTLLTHCDQNALHIELEKARLTLEDQLGASITTMSLPGGRYNKRVIAACEKAGYTQVYTSIPRTESQTPGYLVGRVNVRGQMSGEQLTRLLQPASPDLSRMARQYQMKETTKSLLGDWLYARVWKMVNKAEPESDEGQKDGQ